jgi:hypothetical protein
MKHNVIIYPEAWIKVPNIEADSPEEAVAKVSALMDDGTLDLHDLMGRNFRPGNTATNMEYAEGVDSFKVDVLDERGETTEGTHDFCSDGKTPYHESRSSLVAILSGYGCQSESHKAEAVRAGLVAGLDLSAVVVKAVGQDDPLYPREDWQYQVSNGDTNLGYLEWVEHCRESSQG